MNRASFRLHTGGRDLSLLRACLLAMGCIIPEEVQGCLVWFGFVFQFCKNVPYELTTALGPNSKSHSSYVHDQTLQPYPDFHSPRQDCREALSPGSTWVWRGLRSRAQPLGKRNQFKQDSQTLDSTQKLKRVGGCALFPSLESLYLNFPQMLSLEY